MRPLEDQTIARRVITTFIIVVVILLLLAFIGWISGGWDQADAQQQRDVHIYDGIPPDAQLIQLDRIALREAYHQHVVNLWLVWLKGQAGDATYFKNGLVIARRAYAQALTQISRRESEIMEQEQRK